MAADLVGKGYDGGKVGDKESSWCIRSKVDHSYVFISDHLPQSLGTEYSPPTIGIIIKYMYLKSLKILSNPIRKPVVSNSFAVAVHSILILKK